MDFLYEKKWKCGNDQVVFRISLMWIILSAQWIAPIIHYLIWQDQKIKLMIEATTTLV
jgi:hypothetical protein